MATGVTRTRSPEFSGVSLSASDPSGIRERVNLGIVELGAVEHARRLKAPNTGLALADREPAGTNFRVRTAEFSGILECGPQNFRPIQRRLRVA
jgi:hypothetical protein